MRDHGQQIYWKPFRMDGEAIDQIGQRIGAAESDVRQALDRMERLGLVAGRQAFDLLTVRPE